MVKVNLQTKLLGANELIAMQNHKRFDEQGLLAINLMSSPGSGKTSILEKTIEALGGKIQIAVIEGDLYTDQDARRIENKGVPVIQINTDGACHLDASMVGKAFEDISAHSMNLLFIENVGNLVCPAEFELGEDCRAVVISVAEGNDKITKYPLIFQRAKVVLVNKIDLIEYTDFSIEQLKEDLARINPDVRVFYVSARTGQGIDAWAEWLLEEVARKRTKV